MDKKITVVERTRHHIIINGVKCSPNYYPKYMVSEKTAIELAKGIYGDNPTEEQKEEAGELLHGDCGWDVTDRDYTGCIFHISLNDKGVPDGEMIRDADDSDGEYTRLGKHCISVGLDKKENFTPERIKRLLKRLERHNEKWSVDIVNSYIEHGDLSDFILNEVLRKESA